MLLKRRSQSLPGATSPIRGREGFENVVLQPSRTCNLNCDYCYLPYRRSSAKMPVAVAVAVADAISHVSHSVAITWHGGEPLTTPLEHFAALVAPFAPLQSRGQVEHIVQSNGTLLNEAWAEFLRSYSFHVGISIDGDRVANDRRRNWARQDTFDATLRGIEVLKRAAIPFSVIAVVGSDSILRAAELYAFFVSTGCFSVGINIEEQLGGGAVGCGASDSLVSRFWAEFFQAWRLNPAIQVREFVHAFCWFDTVLMGQPTDRSTLAVDLFPTVDCDGRVTLLSPEFVDAHSSQHGGFVVGNVLHEDLLVMLDRAGAAAYVRDFVAGCAECRKSCEYFSACGGGTAANKFFELGTTAGTQTRACRVSEQLLIEEVLNRI